MPAEPGYRLCLLHRPAAPARGIVVQVHAFAEEMNRTRRMAALMSRRLAASGWVVVQIDLLGCGDSSGELSDATFEAWDRDLELALQRARSLAPGAASSLWFWCIRAGALLAPPLLDRHHNAHLLLWQPAPSGAQVLAQFLRLRVAAQSFAGERVDTRSLREQLAADGRLDVAGYPLGHALALQMERARLDLPAGHRGRVVWIENDGATPGELSPLAQAHCTRWLAAGGAVTAMTAPGPPFWQTQETSEAPAFIEQSLAAMDAA